MADMHFDACVVGGGPAGSVTALRLAQLGYRVCLAERSAFPRLHVGESLSPGIWPILDVLGLREPLLKMAYPKPVETLISWAEPNIDRSVRGRRAAVLLVERGSFDAFLLNAARCAGVQIFQPGRLNKASRDESGWRAEVIAEGDSNSIHATFLVDATGRNGFLPRKRKQVSPRTIALCGYLQTDNRICATMVEALSDAWCWAACIPGGAISTMVFVDPDLVRHLPRVLLETFWRDKLSNGILFASIARSPLVSPVFARDATAYVAPDPNSLYFIRVGEASFGLDPLSSTGVEKAMQSGLIAAITIHTMILRPERKELCARFYTSRQSETVSTHAAWSAEYYQKVERFAANDFWRKRSVTPESASPETRLSNRPVYPALLRAPTWVRISADTRLVEEPCVLGDEICARMTLSHPSLDRPVAFVDDTEIASLLEIVPWSPNLELLIARWTSRISVQRAHHIASWLIKYNILEAVS